MAGIVIRTSSTDWLQSLAVAYKARSAVTLVDDAGYGVDPMSQTLLQMGLRGQLAPAEWTAVAIALGVGVLGAWVVVMAVLDPEPFSKVATTIFAGAVMTMGGGFSAIRVITGHKPPHVRCTAAGFEIGFE
jgi:hypothetical protein